MEPNRIEKVPLRDLKTEDGAEELVDSAMMRPYVRLAEAMLANKGLKEAVTEIDCRRRDKTTALPPVL
jgi:hypothetical protein